LKVLNCAANEQLLETSGQPYTAYNFLKKDKKRFFPKEMVLHNAIMMSDQKFFHKQGARPVDHNLLRFTNYTFQFTALRAIDKQRNIYRIESQICVLNSTVNVISGDMLYTAMGPFAPSTHMFCQVHSHAKWQASERFERYILHQLK
jgi:hypothetical protein